MPATQLPLALPPHTNKGLFSDYYLDSIVPTQNEWFDLNEAARPIWNRLRERFATLKPEQLDESQLEEQWVKFVLVELGWHYSVQVKIRYGATGNRRPDYALTGSHDSAQSLTNQIYTPAELRDAGVLAVADAKKWAVPLDQAPRGERNPSQQIDEYLRYSELRWGILTDGRTWRLYERDTSKNNVFYAVDLKALLESSDDEALNRFLYFYAFFRQTAFIANGWLDRTLAGSTDFAQSLSDTLEDQVYDALELIAQGFLDYRRNALKPTPETLRELYEQSLVLLYRLLFILYAESRDILPIKDNHDYQHVGSLYALKTQIALDTNANSLNDDGSRIYSTLKDLFFGIDQGNPRYNLPAYNGGLFAATDHPFLDKYTIGDRRVAAAIDKMARIPDKTKQGALLMVDYRDLDVRHLGAIYEKLLEYVLDFATEPLTIKDDLYVPAQTGDKVAKQPGDVFLRTGNNQRKVTGSYYTPDYIVRFIVERTLEPLLTAITERYATRDEEGRWVLKEDQPNLALNPQPLPPQPGVPVGEGESEATLLEAPRLGGEGLGVRSENKDIHFVPDALIEAARRLRYDSTTAEEFLWECLRDRRLNNLKFRRQHPIKGTVYIADFYCNELSLIIELDGGIHERVDQKNADQVRQIEIEALGYRVLRFKNEVVFDNIRQVLISILAFIPQPDAALNPQPLPPQPGVPVGEGESKATLLEAPRLGGEGLGVRAGEMRAADLLRNAILALNVLDPATGSGHFMVDTMAYIAEWLRGLALAPADLAPGEDELLYWKRQVVLACIYGVDVNPLAVELAKLSLWLATISRGKPLSFLDHHIQCGNTLVGARADEIGVNETAKPKRAAKSTKKLPNKGAQAQEVGQFSMFGESDFAPTLSFAIDQMNAIEHNRADSIDQVKLQEAQYAALIERLAQWRRTADVWTAKYFGVSFDQPTWKLLSQSLRGQLIAEIPGLRDIATRGEAIAHTQRFFHWELVFPEVFFAPDGTPKADPGFDAIVGNPPYVRQEYIQPIKNFLAAKYPDIYSGTADLYVYFYGRGLGLLRRGGLMGYITANKWFRSGYGEGLRGYLAEHAAVREIVDFGDAPIFKGAETFPAVVVIGKPALNPQPLPPQPGVPVGEGESAATLLEAPRLGGEGLGVRAGSEPSTRVTIFPRNMLQISDLTEYADEHGYSVSTKRLTKEAWSLATSEDETLLTKIRESGVPLTEWSKIKPFYGIKTGFNKAFLIDTATKDRLIREDSRSAQIIKPFLRGENIERWSPDWEGEWIILIKSSENQVQSWSQAGDQAETIFSQTYPSIYQYFKTLEDKLQKRQDQGRFWWELRSCAYYDVFEQPKLVYQVIQTYPAYSLDAGGYLTNDKCFILPSTDLYLLTVLNSPLMWWYGHRFFGHMLNDALNPAGEKMVSLPIALPTDAIRAEIEPAAGRLIALTKTRRDAIRDVLAWLRVEFAVETPGQKIEAFSGLDELAFIAAVKDRRPKGQKLTPASLRQLTETYHEYAAQIGQIDSEAGQLERRVSDLVNTAYGLTAADIDLLWRTAPPRMPFTRP